jgi:predicted dehydrogenase
MGPGRYDPAYEEGGLDYPTPFVRWTERRNMQAYLELLRAGQVQWRPLVTHDMTMGEAEAAFQVLENDPAALAISLRYEPEAPVETPPSPRTMAARRMGKAATVRLGVIGAGSFARSVHFPLLRRMTDRFSVTGVATRSGLSSAVAAREAGAAVSTSDYRELLAREDVDAVLIATRHDQHAHLATEALAAGKGVFLEKPLALELAELDALLDSVASAGLPFLVGFNRRFSRATKLLRERLAAHAAPAVLQYRVNAARGGPADWSRTEEGGGRAVGEACHMLDFLHAVIEQPLDDLQTMARPGEDADANFSVQLRFRNGTLAQLLYTTLGHPALPKERIEVFLGDEIVLIDDFRAVEIVKHGVRARRRIRVDKGYRDEWAAFHAACTTGPALPIPLVQLRSVALATFAIRDAVRS